MAVATLPLPCVFPLPSRSRHFPCPVCLHCLFEDTAFALCVSTAFATKPLPVSRPPRPWPCTLHCGARPVSPAYPTNYIFKTVPFIAAPCTDSRTDSRTGSHRAARRRRFDLNNNVIRMGPLTLVTVGECSTVFHKHAATSVWNCNRKLESADAGARGRRQTRATPR